MIKYLLLLMLYNPQTGEIKDWENPVLGYSQLTWCQDDLNRLAAQRKPPEGFEVIGRCVSAKDLK